MVLKEQEGHKTTMLLQYLKENHVALDYKMYLSLNDLYFLSDILIDYVGDFLF